MSNFVDFVDFEDCNDNDTDKNIAQLTDNQDEDIKIISLYKRDGKSVMFDDKTMLYYTALRKTLSDPFTLEEVNDSYAFKFPHQWNPGSGERLEFDPYGPLCFHPDNLIKYFHTQRLNGLWVNETQEDGIFYQGYYDSYVGSGEDIYIQSRGYNAEKYLFRLPIIDCYSARDSPNMIAITCGPKLTDDEIKLIDTLAKKSGPYRYGAHRPNLCTMKKLYDNALSKNPECNISIDVSTIDSKQLQNLYDDINRKSVDLLRRIKG